MVLEVGLQLGGEALAVEEIVHAQRGGRPCPRRWGRCPCRRWCRSCRHRRTWRPSRARSSATRGNRGSSGQPGLRAERSRAPDAAGSSVRISDNRWLRIETTPLPMKQTTPSRTMPEGTRFSCIRSCRRPACDRRCGRPGTAPTPWRGRSTSRTILPLPSSPTVVADNDDDVLCHSGFSCNGDRPASPRFTSCRSQPAYVPSSFVRQRSA